MIHIFMLVSWSFRSLIFPLNSVLRCIIIYILSLFRWLGKYLKFNVSKICLISLWSKPAHSVIFLNGKVHLSINSELEIILIFIVLIFFAQSIRQSWFFTFKLVPKFFTTFTVSTWFKKKKKTNQRLEQDSLAVKAAFIKTCNNDKNSGKLNIAEISTVDQAPCWVLETWWWIRHICGTSSYIGVNGGQINQWENEVITDYFKSHEWN